ncbi:L-myo-inositol-1-phosphate synthase [Sulfolobales archaeon HS-7]|nr:L-myo-inositol-1-phosphate synthase [Sulfolobales archaeon HS-7]
MVKVSLIGVGNAASAYVQAVNILRKGGTVLGVDKRLGDPREIEIVSAIDIDKRKVSLPLKDAIFAPPNVVEKYTSVDEEIIVKRGITVEPIEGKYAEIIEESEDKPVDIEEEFKKNKAEVILCLIPSGMSKTTMYYARAAANAHASFINATPAPVTSEMKEVFESRGLLLFGDDLLSQMGGTILHTELIDVLKRRGVNVKRSFQVDISGTAEANLTLDDKIKEIKKNIKSSFISQSDDSIEVTAGTSDYVNFLKDRRVSYMVIEGEYAFNVPVRIDISLKTYDGPNAASPLINLTLIALKLRQLGYKGVPDPICSHYFKSPPRKKVADVYQYMNSLSVNQEDNKRRLSI